MTEEHAQDKWPIDDSEMSRRIEFILDRLKVTKSPHGFRPVKKLSGVNEESLVWVIRTVEGKFFVAKCDKADRAEKEWKNVESLLNLPFPPQIILPYAALYEIYAGQNYSERVMITEHALDTIFGHAVKLFTFKEFLEKYLNGEADYCVQAFSEGAKLLFRFQEIERDILSDTPGAGQPYQWLHFFGKLAAGDPRTCPNLSKKEYWLTVLPRARQDGHDVDWERDKEIPINRFLGVSRKLPNPLEGVEDRLNTETGEVFVSRIHNDMNLGNLLVAFQETDKSTHAMLIDMAESIPNDLTVRDFARMEIELWHDLFCKCVREHGVSAHKIPLCLTALRDILDGRLASFGDGVPIFTKNFCVLISHVRDKAGKRIGAGRTNNTIIREYFHALYFSFLWALRSDRVLKDNIRFECMLLSAALCLEVLNELDAGHYVESSPSRLLDPMRVIDESSFSGSASSGTDFPWRTRQAYPNDDIRVREKVILRRIEHLLRGDIPDAYKNCEGHWVRMLALQAVAEFRMSTGALARILEFRALILCVYMRVQFVLSHLFEVTNLQKGEFTKIHNVLEKIKNLFAEPLASYQEAGEKADGCPYVRIYSFIAMRCCSKGDADKYCERAKMYEAYYSSNLKKIDSVSTKKAPSQDFDTTVKRDAKDIRHVLTELADSCKCVAKDLDDVVMCLLHKTVESINNSYGVGDNLISTSVLKLENVIHRANMELPHNTRTPHAEVWPSNARFGN